jgi:hypothetical protein
MLRRASSAAFALALVLVAACGHQVTPSPTSLNSDLAGHIQVKFQVNGTLDFSNVVYVIAIDSCGTGVPYPNAFATSYNSYTFAFLVGGGFGSTALPLLYQYYVNPNSSGNLTKLPVNNLNPSTTQFNPNYNGTGSEFEFTFLRSDIDNPLQIPLPCPNSTPLPSSSPTSTPTPTPTVTAGASPTPTAAASPTASGATPSPSPTPTPTATAFSPYLTNWTFNLMTFSPQQVPLDSLGYGGPTDNTFGGIVVNTLAQVSPNSFRSTPQSIPQNPSAYIVYGEVDNYP